MRRWLVAGALIEGPAGLLLVQNLRKDGSRDWTPPGGVIDPGEAVRDGLAREVREETGLEVSAWEGPVYIVEAEAPDLQWSLRVEVHRAMAYDGELRVGGDPDGIVVDACFVDDRGCSDRVADAHHWVREPLEDWLCDRAAPPRSFRYLVEGSDLASLRVHRW